MQFSKCITISVFAKQEENAAEIEEGLKKLIGTGLENEKIELVKTAAMGFNERKITIMEIRLEKARHTNQFLKNLASKLNDEQKHLLVRQAETRLDEEYNFFLRLDKERFLKGEYWITDEGNCYHIKISLLCFPKNWGNAIEIVKQIFK